MSSIELYRDRRGDCHAFVEARHGMTFQAARELRERRQNAERTRRERNTLRIALAGWITAAVATVIAVLQAMLD